MKIDRPKIICHMLSSLDGKITFGKINNVNISDSIFDEQMDLYNITQEKLKARAILCGRITMNDFAESVGTPLGEFANSQDVDHSDYVVTNDKDGYFFVVDTKGLLRWKENFINLGSEHLSIHKWNLVIIVTKNTPREYLAYLKEKKIAYIFGGASEINFEETFQKIKEIFKLDTILLEGGGGINGSILEEDLVDELSLLYVPVIVNNEPSPALFYSTPDKFRIWNYKLKSVENLKDDILWLRYVKR
jgi:2,5-diamino-6-(ribosylamino)-4(3H)-pyrimidinone 5'-phosphate reductase